MSSSIRTTTVHSCHPLRQVSMSDSRPAAEPRGNTLIVYRNSSSSMCVCLHVCVPLYTREHCNIVFEPGEWDGANTWMNLSPQTHCFFSSSDYTAPKHHFFFSLWMLLCTCKRVWVRSRARMCVPCPMLACTCRLTLERQKRRARVTERRRICVCMRVLVCLSTSTRSGFSLKSCKM